MGFKYYVDNLLRAKPLTNEEKQVITKIIAEMDTDPDKAAEQAAKFLAHMTGLAAITTTPRGGNIQITRFEIIKTGRYNLALLGITSIGGVKSRVCRVAEELDERQMSAVNSVINDHLVFVSPEDIDKNLLNTVSAFFGSDAMLLAPIVSAAVAIIKSASDVKVFAEGQQNLLTYEELDDSIKELLELFSDSEAIMSKMIANEQLSLFVGGAFDIENLGLVAGRYRVAGGRHGVLAIAGPVRMDYGFVIPRLSFFRDIMSDALTNPI
jgi:heat-inducible transcriptional repressor